jgi:hypothetical protein
LSSIFIFLNSVLVAPVLGRVLTRTTIRPPSPLPLSLFLQFRVCLCHNMQGSAHKTAFLVSKCNILLTVSAIQSMKIVIINSKNNRFSKPHDDDGNDDVDDENTGDFFFV